jgi:hypothetical protein
VPQTSLAGGEDAEEQIESAPTVFQPTKKRTLRFPSNERAMIKY